MARPRERYLIGFGRWMEGLTVFCRMLPALALVVVIASTAGAQANRGPSLSAEGLSERLDDRIADFERALNDMRRIRASLDNGATPEDATKALVAVHRDLIAEGPLGDMIARRGERRGGARTGVQRPGAEGRVPPPPVDVSDDDIRAFAEEHLPDVAQWLSRLSQSEGPLAGRMTGRIRNRIAELVRTEADDPTLAVLQAAELRAEVGVMRAARAVAAAEESGPAQDAVRTALGAQFDAHLALRRYELVRTAERIESLELEIAEREANRASFIESKAADIERRVSGGRAGADRRPRGERP